MQYKNLFKHYAELKKAFNDYDEIIKIQEKDFRQNYNLQFYVEHFEDGERQYNEALKQFEQSTINNAVCYIVNDSFLDKYYGKIFPLEEKNDELMEYFIQESVFCTELLKTHTAKMDQENRQEKLFLDFLIHFMEEVEDIVDVCADKFNPVVIMDKVDLMFNVAFTEQFKNVLLELARITLKNEMNEILKTVVPRFNIDEISPSWYVPDLFTAIYYSVFLNSSNEKIEKTCANPTCYRTFSVEILDKKHLYCNPSCSDCIRQRRHKANKAVRDAEKNNSDNS